MKSVPIMGVPFTYTDQQSFIVQLDERIQKKEKTFVVTANPEIVMLANREERFMSILHEATYVTADGIGIVKAAQLLNNPLPGRVTGYDTMIELLALANEKGYSIYLLGAAKSTLRLTEQNIKSSYPNVQIIGSHDGYFDLNDETIADEIASVKPDLVFVALGVPRQESWISDNLNTFNDGLFIGVGGSFDVIAGTVKRAPAFWQKIHLEWFYRLMKQPSRWKRMLDLPRFAFRIIKMKVRGSTS